MAEEKIALFVTCVVDQILPEIGTATVQVLRETGAQVIFPLEQTCCGQPFFNSGFHPEAIRLAKKTIETLEPFPAVVIPSGSCTTMIRVEYPHLMKDDPIWVPRAKQLAEKTYELTEYLDPIDPSPTEPGHSGVPVTYHDSCHMLRTLRLKEQPRRLLNNLGFEVREMEDPEVCCGFGGLFSIRMPEVSEAMTEEKLSQATETKTVHLVTADPGCLMQLKHHLARRNRSAPPLSNTHEPVPEPVHIAQLLAGRTG